MLIASAAGSAGKEFFSGSTEKNGNEEENTQGRCARKEGRRRRASQARQKDGDEATQ